MNTSQIITFLSDFGTRDGYVGAVKGVIKSISSGIDIVDITHDINPYNIKMAAFAILNYYSLFPDKTVHLSVVDPGVGSERNVIILATKKYYFVGPDNSIFQFVANQEKHKIYSIDPNSIYNNKKGDTFHARDVFAPIAARLAMGEQPQNIGTQIEGLQVSSDKKNNASRSINKTNIEPIIYDQFGNIIFDFTKTDFEAISDKQLTSISFKNFESNQIYHYYSQVSKGKPLFLWNSLGYLELAVNQDSAVEYFNYRETDRVILNYR